MPETAHSTAYWLTVGWWWEPAKKAGRLALWLVFWLVFWPLALAPPRRQGRRRPRPPLPVTLAPTDLDRTCGHPDCGAGPFADLRGLAAHRRSHETVTCPECGTEVGALGIGSHRRSAHGVAGRAKARATTPGPREVRRGLHAILPPGIDLDLTARLAAFVVATDNPNGVIVIGGTYGPSLVARRYVGDIVAAAKEPLLVVTTDQLREAGLA